MLFAAFMGQTGSATASTAHRALAPIDIAIIAVYFVIVFGIGFYFSRKERTSEDYFLASRDIGWFFGDGSRLSQQNEHRRNGQP